MRAVAAVLVSAGSILVGVAAPSARADGTRCARGAGGGAWPSYGADSASTRSQPAEHDLGVANAASLAPIWSASVNGSVQTTPTVASGCVYVSAAPFLSGGAAYAFNADTGDQV